MAQEPIGDADAEVDEGGVVGLDDDLDTPVVFGAIECAGGWR
jgi:hypothetical protein